MILAVTATGLRNDNERDTTMGYGTDGLTFNTLRAGNVERLPQFKNGKGEPAHSEPDGSDWSPAQWLQALVGELGEYANIRKKYERGDIDRATFNKLAADELADVQTYLDILAFRLGINLGEATMAKWNRVSERVGSRLYIDASGVHEMRSMVLKVTLDDRPPEEIAVSVEASLMAAIEQASASEKEKP